MKILLFYFNFKVSLGHIFLAELAGYVEIVSLLWVVHLNKDQRLIGILHFLISLFHVVVENDEISTQIIRHLNSSKGGRVTFIPLNRVKAPRISYPQSSDVIPLLKKLKFSPNFAPAFSQVVSSNIIYLDEWFVIPMFL